MLNLFTSNYMIYRRSHYSNMSNRTRFPIRLVIRDPHVSLNELLQWSRPNRYNKSTHYSSWKKKHQELIRIQLETQLRNRWVFNEEIQLLFVFHTTRRLDIDNLASGTIKVILDGLKKTHVLPDDSPKYIKKITSVCVKTDDPYDWTELYILLRSDNTNKITEILEHDPTQESKSS